MRYITDQEELWHDDNYEVEFFIIVSKDSDRQQIVCDAYNQARPTSYEFEQRTKEYLEEYTDIPRIDEVEELINGDLLIEFSIDFHDSFQADDFTQGETTCDRFLNYMISQTKYTRCFFDGMYWINMQYLYKEIYHLETKLRYILSKIYIDEFYPNLEKFHENLKQEPRGRKDGEQIQTIVEDTAKAGENIFFRFTFSDYRSILDSKDIKLNDLVKILKENSDFDQVQESLLGSTIVTEEHRDFIASINDDLDSIEKIRNAIMHFRKPSKREMENYVKAKDELLRKFGNFEGGQSEEV